LASALGILRGARAGGIFWGLSPSTREKQWEHHGNHDRFKATLEAVEKTSLGVQGASPVKIILKCSQGRAGRKNFPGGPERKPGKNHPTGCEPSKSFSSANAVKIIVQGASPEKRKKYVFNGRSAIFL
jgi:hypothetical protein